jgi:hypothetical protein
MENNWTRKQCEKRMWMWSGAHGSTHDFGARGPAFDPTSKPRTAVRKILSPFFQATDLKPK